MANSNGTYTLTMTVDQPKSALCYDHYLLGTVEGLMLARFETKGTHQLVWTPAAGLTQNELWDIQTKGIRFFYFVDNIPQTIANLLSTVMLFVSEATVGVPDAVAKVNIDFSETRGRLGGFLTLSRSCSGQVRAAQHDPSQRPGGSCRREPHQ